MRGFAISLILLITAMVSIQSGAALAKGLFGTAGPLAMTALRVGLSSLLMVFVARAWKLRLSALQWRTLAAYGVSLGAMNLLFYLALQRIPLGIAVAVEFVGPLGVALYASRRAGDFAWIFFAALGLVLLLPWQNTQVERLDPFGLIVAIAAGLFWGLYIIFGKRLAGEGQSLRISAVGMLFAALVTVPVGLWFAPEKVLDFSLWPMGLAIAILSSSIPYALEMKAMANIPTKTFGILMSVEPVFAIFAGLIVLKESLTTQQWLAIVLIMIASAGSAASVHVKATTEGAKADR